MKTSLQADVIVLHIVLTLANQHVIRLTDNLRDQGFQEDIDLGEVVGEQVVDSKAACGRLCEENDACHSVMLMGQLCRMFGYQNCPAQTTEASIRFESIDPSLPHSYLFSAQPLNSFAKAMEHCASMGAYSVHVNSQQEHDAIKAYITAQAPSCRFVWTGGKTNNPDSQSPVWKWHYSDGSSEPLTYDGWSSGQPTYTTISGYSGMQSVVAIDRHKSGDFNDIHTTWNDHEVCCLCERP